MTYLERYSDFLRWCEDNDYSDEGYEVEEEQYKQETKVSCYIKKKNEDKYARLSYTKSYYYGIYDLQVGEENLTRKEEQVTITKVSFVKQ